MRLISFLTDKMYSRPTALFNGSAFHWWAAGRKKGEREGGKDYISHVHQRVCFCLHVCEACMHPIHNSKRSISPPTPLPQMLLSFSCAWLIKIKTRLNTDPHSQTWKRAFMLMMLCYSHQGLGGVFFLCLIDNNKHLWFSSGVQMSNAVPGDQAVQRYRTTQQKRFNSISGSFCAACNSSQFKT